MRLLTLTLTGRETDFTTFHQPVIKLQEDTEYEAALLSLDMYYSIPNVTDENNNFRYSTDGGSSRGVVVALSPDTQVS